MPPDSTIPYRRSRHASLDRDLPPAKRYAPSHIFFPEPADRISLRKRFVIMPELEPGESIRDKDDELLVRNWLKDNPVCCNRSRTGFCYCDKQSERIAPSLPPEILHDIFNMAIPPDCLLNPSISCGPNSAWCSSMVAKRSVILVSKSWYDAGIDLLYRNIVIRRVPAMQALLVALTTKPRLGAFVRNITVSCHVPTTYSSTIHPDLTQILSFCSALRSLNHLPPFPPPKPYPFPPMPPTITSLKLSRHDRISAVYDTLLQSCAQLTELSINAKDDEVFDALQLSFPCLHTLSLTLGGDVAVQNFSTKWDMPKLRRLTFRVSSDFKTEHNLALSYHHLIQTHGRKLQYLAFPGLIPAVAPVSPAIAIDFTPLLGMCPVLEHVVFPHNHWLSGHRSFPSITSVDLWKSELYKNLRLSDQKFPRFPNIESPPRFLDTALIALIDDVPRTFDRRVRGNWSLAFPGLGIRQDEKDGLVTIQVTDLLVVDSWDFTYFGAIEMRGVRREQELFDCGDIIRMVQHNASFQARRSREYAESLTVQQPRIHRRIRDDPETVDNLPEDLLNNWLEDESDGGSEDSWFSLEDEDETVLEDEFYLEEENQLEHAP
ncbi:hypothetical protein DFH09DRAFT_574216 [Mycena vulgaris]|nr:hypothetical protein DFH09DRAFT_574216 [Mycena vulgaris]